ncbi:hypothetical protein [Vagococcus sp.]|uniref:hypothetical protein n=1 Tax=Vagococcus sp. TaxID=1933889 RepID=UPI003F970F3D
MTQLPTDQTQSLASLISDKITLVFDNHKNEANDADFSSMEWDPSSCEEELSFFDLSSKVNVMIPFLTVQENLLLGISRKDTDNVIDAILTQLPIFHLPKRILEASANEVTQKEQVLLQIIRAISLKKIVVFDHIDKDKKQSLFINSILPALFKIKKNQIISVIILTDDKELLDSVYYDQVFFIKTK